MKRSFFFTLTLALVFLVPLTGTWASGAGESGTEKELGPGLYAELQTSRGTMVFLLDYENLPLTVTNFCGLAEGSLPNDVRGNGEAFFDGLPFYREAPGYAVFSGDPEGTGNGGPGYTLPRETGSSISAGDKGVLVMDGFVTESAGSRFFITLSGDSFLDTKYTPFGTIVRGRKVLNKVKKGDLVEKVSILRIGAAAEGLVFNEEKLAEYRDAARAAELALLRAENELLADVILSLGDDRRKTSTGIYYTILTPGEGDNPKSGNQVSMHYTGSLLDGTVFDSSRVRGATFDFTLGVDGIIPGWVEMIVSMRPGEKRQVVLPPSQAYGSQGYGPIEPNSWLVFEMELVGVAEL